MSDRWAALAPLGRRRRYPRSSIVFAEGDDAHEVLVVLAGQLTSTVGAYDGRQVIVEVLGPGELVGELAVLDGAPRSASVRALTDAEVLAVGRDAFRDALRRDGALAGAVLDVLVGRVRASTDRQLELGGTDAMARVCRRLVESAARFGRPDGAGGTVVRSPLTQQDLASWAGLSREAVVKALRTLRSLGWVEMRDRALVVRDLDAVTARALGATR